jgi:iron complex outermembrane receptor protein
MKCEPNQLPSRAACGAVAGAAFLFSLTLSPAALAQEEAPEAEEAQAQESGPEAPAQGTAIDPETLEVVPVDAAAPAEAGAAADKESTELDTIEVTGSRIKRSDYETEAPVLVIKREDIEKAGLVAIGDILQNLPQAGAALSRSFNNGGNGATEVDLRNLGSNRVLVLVNGRRWVSGVSAFNTSGVDLNTIPISIIDSIEILKDGASAIYGSDAIAGVINIKTRRDYVGAEVRSHYETTQEGDGVSKLLTFSGGTVAGKTSVFFDVSYVDQGELSSGDREQTDIPKFGIPRDNISRGSRFMEYTNTIFIPTANNAQAINSHAGMPQGGVLSACPDITLGLQLDENIPVIPLPAGSVVPLCDLTLDHGLFAQGTRQFKRVDLNTDAYNYAPVNYLITPNERAGIYGQISHAILDNLRFSSEVLYNVRKSRQVLAETPDALGNIFAGVHPFDLGYVAADNPYNPTNPQSPYYIPGAEAQDIGNSAPDGVVGLGAVLKRFRELGPRVFSQDVDTMRVAGGLDGSFEYFNRLFSWDAGFAFGENKLHSTDQNLVDNERLARASGPLNDCVGVTDPNTGTITPPPPVASGCVPFDWFGGPGSPTPEQLNYIRYTAVDVSKQRQRLAYGNVTTEFGELSKWLAGPLGMAAGLEYREEFFSAQPDPLKVKQTSSTNSVGPTRGVYDVTEGYVEARAPVVAERKWIEELELSLAGRYSKYSSFGDNLSGKFGVRYKPIQDLILRSTYSTAFRAPAITDLYLGQAVSFPVVNDPCDKDAADQTANEQQNCTADGATGQATSQIATVFGGNPELEPETAKTLSLGFVYSPEFLPDFNFYLDWYTIAVEDFISPLGPDQILALCYSAPPDQRAFCDAVHRSGGQLTSIDAIFQNFSNVDIKGVDFNFDWILPLPEYVTRYAPGQFQWVLDAAYVTAFDVTVPTSGGEETVGNVGVEFGGFGAIPRWKVNTGLNWRLGDWEAAWNMRYIHHIWEACDDGFGDPGAQGQVLENPTPVLSLDQYGLCSDTNNPSALFGYSVAEDGTVTPGKANELKATIYNDIQAGWSVPNWNSKLTFGIVNFLDQDPPASRSAFADSYDKATYDPWGSRTPYVRFQVSF